ncbi:ACT domain-containing protein [Thermomonas fusca]|uniref:ACT domain-containing protein n=1 Tax=Thermomonas fusca TaxID=215690 RepID=A0A5R9PJ18_9GAMM|nr:ACT domain-containing protein [Thermomonas fusca]TLX23226.1 ACT domain-containing protein [Thermomonas fusca]
MPLRLSLLPQTYVIARLAADAPVPAGVLEAAGFASVSRTADELSIVCPQEVAPPAPKLDGGWRTLKLHGPFAFDEVGILAALLAPLAEAGIGIFAVSTFDTDYLLVKATALPRAMATLRGAGHSLVE